MKFAISIGTFVYPKPLKEVIGYGYADSAEQLLSKFIHEPDDLLQRLKSLSINMYFDALEGIQILTVPEISTYAKLLALILKQKAKWAVEQN